MAEKAEKEEVEQNDEFAAAFAESAKLSEKEGKESSGEVGDQGAANDQDFENSFNEAAASPAADGKEVENPVEDLAAKLAAQEAEIERLKQSERSQRGRVSALTKKLEEQRAAVKPPEVDEEDKSEDWETFVEEFPEMAAIVEARLKKVEKRVGNVEGRVENVGEIQNTLVSGEIDAYKQEQFEKLKEKHPDFETIKDSPMFAAYKLAAPPEIQAKIKSKHAKDASAVLDAFKEFAGWKPEPPPKPGKSDIELINERRAMALKQSQGISTKPMAAHPPRRDTEADDDFAAAFAEGAAKKEKTRSVRY